MILSRDMRSYFGILWLFSFLRTITMFNFKKFFICISACFFIVTAVTAESNDLYAEAPPDDASFIRFIGFEDTNTVEFSGKTFTLFADEFETYIPVSSTKLDNIPSGSFVTVMSGANSSTKIIYEGARDTSSKVFLFLINGSDNILDLRLSDNSASVIDNVLSGQALKRGVNPVAVTLGVFSNDADIPIATFDVSLKRGQNISFIVDKAGVRLIQNRFGAVAH